jgi:hypothetical protein
VPRSQRQPLAQRALQAVAPDFAAGTCGGGVAGFATLSNSQQLRPHVSVPEHRCVVFATLQNSLLDALIEHEFSIWMLRISYK